MSEPTSSRLWIFVVVAGVLGGGALILTTRLTRTGPMIFLPYAVLIVAVVAFLRSQRVTLFARRFGYTFAAFVIATLALFIYLDSVVNPQRLHDPMWRLFWPFGVFVLIGAVVSAIAAKFATARMRPGGHSVV